MSVGVADASTKQLLFSALSKMRKPHVAKALRDYLSGADDDLDVL